MSTKISLRAIEKTDLDFLHRLYNNTAIMNYWFEEAYYSKAKLEENFEKQKKDSNCRRFILHTDNEKLGFVALYNIDFIHRKAEFAIMIDPRQQGKGYAIPATNHAKDYAFRTLNLNKLYLIADHENEKAIHIYEKAGFKQEAVLKDEFFVNGSYRNIVYMSIFQKEYLKNSSV